MKVSLLSYPYHASKHTGRGHDRYVAEFVDNTRGQAGVELTVIDPGFAKNTLHGLLKLPGHKRRPALLRELTQRQKLT